MFVRVFLCCLVCLSIISCDFFSYKNRTDIQLLDTVVSFNSVDSSPSFKACDSLLEKAEKTTCFRNTMHQKIGAALAKHSFTSKDSVAGLVYLELQITNKGKIVLQKITADSLITLQLPKLDSILEASIATLPIIFPATKRGVPVTASYNMPIKIKVTD